jgi:hypothetical protein
MKINDEWVESAKRCAAYTFNSDATRNSYRNWVAEGSDPTEHVLYHSAVVLDKTQELDVDVQEYDSR